MDKSTIDNLCSDFGIPVKRPVGKGSTVKYQNGYYRTTRVTKKTVNLGPVFGGGVYFKGISIDLVEEAYDEWYENWSQSDSYKCM